jgi:hypothetical protein
MSAKEMRPPLVRIIAHSARSTPNAVTLALSLTAGLLLGNVWLMLAGSWLYALLVARNATSVRYRRLVADAEAEVGRQLPAEGSLVDPTLMLVARALRKGYEEIERHVKETPEPVREHLRAAVASLEDVRGQAAQLIRDADQLSGYLLSGPAEATQAAIQRLSHDLAGASDATVKREYQGALSVRHEQLAAVSQIAAEHARMLAALQFIVGMVESFPAWVLRLRVLESRAQQDRVTEIYDELGRMKAELATSLHLLEGFALEATARERAGELAPFVERHAEQHHGHDRQEGGDEKADQVAAIDEHDLQAVDRLAVDGTDVRQGRHFGGLGLGVIWSRYGDASLEAPAVIAGATAGLDDAAPAREKQLRPEGQKRPECEQGAGAGKERQ